jgi:WD40 repeat protein
MGIDSNARRLASPLDIAGEEKARFLGVWDTQTGRRLATIEAGSAIQATNSIVFSRDGDRVVYRTSADNVVHVSDISTGKEVFALQLTGKAVIRTWRYSFDGKRLLTGDSWGGIQVWDAANGTLLRTTQHHRSSVIKFEYSADRRFYASVANDGSAQVWDVSTDQPIGELLEQPGAASRAEFSPDSTRIATPSAGGTARVWDVRTGLPVTEPFNSDGDPTSVVAFTPDGRFLEVHGGANALKQHIRVWSVPPLGNTRTPDWLLDLATICAGHRLSDEGKIVGALDQLAKIADVQRALAAAPADDAYAEWARWILSDSPTRPIGPGFTVTPAEAKKLRAEFLQNPVATSPPPKL